MDLAFGRYRLLERLGEGGMAEVFKAKSYGVEGFEKVLVIKRILPELARNPAFVELFVREAKLAVRLSHANIVQVFDLGIAPTEGGDGAYFIAMEYVHGFDLAKVLQRTSQQGAVLPVAMCVHLVAEVAKGLDHAHRRRDEQLRPLGIVHCDVSPQNVLLSFEGEVKVTDFGIAKARDIVDLGGTDEDTFARKLRGKFAYMSPEQASHGRVDARSDLFSLGVVLYELLTGVNPFRAASTFETLRRVQAAEVPPVELLRPDLPPALVEIVQTSLQKDPAARFADAGRMYETLLAFLYRESLRFGSHELASFMSSLRHSDRQTPIPLELRSHLDDGDTHAPERTPVEVPSIRIQRPRPTRELTEAEKQEAPRERREVTALAIEWADRSTDVNDDLPIVLDVLRRYGAQVVESDASQVIAYFGVRDPDGRDTEIGTRAALVALRSCARASSAGLHSGQAFINDRNELLFDAQVSRLTQVARELARVHEGRLAISAVAMRQIKEHFDFESFREMSLPTLSVSGVFVREQRHPADAFGRFVGRKEELRVIGEVLAAATRRVPQILTLRGDHGTGKTRLLYEVERRLRKGHYNVGFYIATCPPRGVELPLSGIASMLRALCGINDGDSLERIKSVGPRLRALGLQDEEVSAVLAPLGGPASRTRHGLRNGLVRMMTRLAEDRSHCVAFDVAHCIDEASFSILKEVYEHLATARFVWLFSGRAGFTHPLEVLSHHAPIELGDLSSEDAERLVSLRLAIDKAPDELTRFVRERAGGHPLFIEEVLKALVDGQAVKVADHKLVSMRLVGQELTLPKTLRGLVASRVARLSADERRVLYALSILGEPVDAELLSAMLEDPIALLDKSLDELERSSLIVRSGAIQLQFSSPLIPEIVSATLPQERAQELHTRAGAALVSTLQGRALEQASRIATHLFEAGDREAAATYFGESGRQALAASRFESATRDFARAIALAHLDDREPDQVAGWLSGLSRAIRFTLALPNAIDLCDSALLRLDAAGSTQVRVLGRVDAGHILAAIHRVDLATAHFSRAEEIAGLDEKLLMPVLLASAEQSIFQGDFKRAHELLERLQSLESFEAEHRDRRKILVNLAQAHAASGDRARALATLELAARQANDGPAEAAEIEKLRGLIDYFSRDFRGAAAHFESAIDHARAGDISYEIAGNLHNLGDALVRMGEFAKAFGALQQSLALCDDLGYERLGSLNRVFLAYLDGLVGNKDAERLLRQGVSYAEHHEFTWDAISGRLFLAQLLIERGRRDEGRGEFAKLRDLADRAGNRLVVTDCDNELGRLSLHDSVSLTDP